MEEFFCDLFGVLTVGPAYAWAHYHLCIKRGGDPFATPLIRETSHPADDARMQGMLGMLRSVREFDSEADSIERAWREFIDAMAYRATAEYHLCYSGAQIDAITRAAKEGVEGIGIVTATSRTNARVRDSLNDAWRVFWKAPADFPAWEVDEVRKLLPQRLLKRPTAQTELPRCGQSLSLSRAATEQSVVAALARLGYARRYSLSEG